MKEKMMICGKRHFDATPVTVTDPCYSKGTWCTVDTTIPEGDYRLGLWRTNHWYANDETKKHEYYTRVSAAFILNEKVRIGDYIRGQLHHVEIGEAGVDAGVCGFYQNKPDYDDQSWYDFCNKIKDRDYLITEEGFCTSSGWGDGGYDVYSLVNKEGVVVGLEVRYM